MAQLPHKMEITLDIEPIVKLACNATNCKFNLFYSGSMMSYCNLKQVTIGEDACCKDFQPIEDKSNDSRS